ncbi:MAG: T9SS type A sorting domain-containing protein, partial [Bacteroidota bacterium]
DCGKDTITAELGILTGLNVPDLGEEVKIAPNPNRGSFAIQFTGQSMTDTWVQLTDGRGRIVYRQELGNLSTGATHRVDLENELSEGVYLLQIQSAEGRAFKRVIIE